MNPIFEKVQQRNYQQIQINTNRTTPKIRSGQEAQKVSDSKALEWAAGLTSGVVLIGLGVSGIKKLSSRVSQKAAEQAENIIIKPNLSKTETVIEPKVRTVIKEESKASPKPVKTEQIKEEPAAPKPIETEQIKEEPAAPKPIETEQIKEEPTAFKPIETEQVKEEPTAFKPIETEQVKEELTVSAKEAVHLEETIKTYIPHDITVYGFLNGKWLRGNDDAVIDKNVMSKLKKLDTTVLYDKTDNSTQIIMPFGDNFYSIRINGIISEKRALDAARSVNSYGLGNPADFSHVIVRSLNKNQNNFYTKQNIGISYDFHDNGYKVFRAEGADLYASDGRILLRKVIQGDTPWEGTYFCYFNNGQLASTQISVALPSTGNERAATNNYTISLSGLISPEKCRELIKHLNSTVIKNPKDVKEAELPFIQEEVLKFINSH